MTTYIYLPVPTDEMQEFAKKLNLPKGRILCNPFVSGRMKGVARFFGGCLRSVGGTDTLLLIAHGNGGGSTRTGADRKDGLKAYTSGHLAQVLMSEGLTKSFSDLRLLVCGSAENRALKGLAPLGRRLCDDMKTLGYANIAVTGYKGLVSTDSGSIQVARNGINGGGYYPGDEDDSHTVYR